jgi:hypothetical protein
MWHTLALFLHTIYFAACFYSVKQANVHLLEDTLQWFESTNREATHTVLNTIIQIDTMKECYVYGRPDNAATYADRLFQNLAGENTWRFLSNARQAAACFHHPKNKNAMIKRMTREWTELNREKAVTIYSGQTQKIIHDIQSEWTRNTEFQELYGLLDQYADNRTKLGERVFGNDAGKFSQFLREDASNYRPQAELPEGATPPSQPHHRPQAELQDKLLISEYSFIVSNYALFLGTALELSHTYFFKSASHTPLKDLINEISRNIRKYSQTIHAETIKTKNYLDELAIAVDRIYTKMGIAYERTVWIGVKGTALMVQYMYYVYRFPRELVILRPQVQA